MPGVHVNRSLQRAHRAARRGLQGLGRRVPDFTEARWDSDTEPYTVNQERRQRAHLEALDAGRALIAAALELEHKAEAAKAAGVETLRHAEPAVSWRELGDLLGVSGQAAHKRYRDVDGPEAQLTIEDAITLEPGELGPEETHHHTPEQLAAAAAIGAELNGRSNVEVHRVEPELEPPARAPEIERPTPPPAERKPPAREPRPERPAPARERTKDEVDEIMQAVYGRRR